jgi:hypothetical protein
MYILFVCRHMLNSILFRYTNNEVTAKKIKKNLNNIVFCYQIGIFVKINKKTPKAFSE